MRSYFFLLLTCFWACTRPNFAQPTPTPTPAPLAAVPALPGGAGPYPWLRHEYDSAQAIGARMAPPAGCRWTGLEGNDFAAWLLGLPLLPEGAKVHLFDGRLKANQTAQAAVLDLDVGDRDLQQCADAVMRLRAEFLYARKDYAHIAFRFTSGHRVCFDDWRKGKKPLIKGNSVTFSAENGKTDNSYANFQKYLRQIFTYAGTASLSKELKAVPTSEMRPGDVFIQGGFPGHAVIVLGMAENASGKRYFLLGQSYMPAQEMHVLRNPAAANANPWYPLDFGETLETPEWTFSAKDLKRW